MVCLLPTHTKPDIREKLLDAERLAEGVLQADVVFVRCAGEGGTVIRRGCVAGGA